LFQPFPASTASRRSFNQGETTMTPGPERRTEPDTPDSELELLKLRVDYAWKWFSFHADQRTKMFNFMLVVVGIFAAGVAGAWKDGIPELAGWLCVVPAVLTIVFMLLDRRNRDLVWLGEDVLRELEKRYLFGENAQIANPKDKQIPYGILWRQTREEKDWLTRDYVTLSIRDAWLGKHRVWLKLIALLICVAFIVGAVYVFSNAKEIAKRATPVSSAAAKSEPVTPNVAGKQPRNRPVEGKQ